MYYYIEAITSTFKLELSEPLERNSSMVNTYIQEMKFLSGENLEGKEMVKKQCATGSFTFLRRETRLYLPCQNRAKRKEMIKMMSPAFRKVWRQKMKSKCPLVMANCA